MPELRLCAIIPTFNNPMTIAAVVNAVRGVIADVIVVDDASSEAGERACAELGAAELAVCVRRNCNGGKGAAVKTGFEEAVKRGFTHAVQVDADGQHDLTQLAALIEAARAAPDALVLGYPIYDASAPKGRMAARKITRFWVNLEVGAPGIVNDAMVGFRVYPLKRALGARATSDRMDFDVEIVVRMVWDGAPVVNVPVQVRYLTAEEGGVSHFQAVRDNLRISRLHSRLMTEKCMRWFFNKIFGSRGAPGLPPRGEASDESGTWLTERERGALAGLKLVHWIAMAVGRGPARAVVGFVAFWYALTDARSRKYSREWLTRTGQASGWWAVYQHILRFAHAALDRIFLVSSGTETFSFERTGNEYLVDLAQSKRGAMLMGAHLGSFEAMRAGATGESFPINIVGHIENARMINALLAEVSHGKSNVRVIHVGTDPVAFALKVRERLAEGEMIAILADRVGLNDKQVVVDFFGAPAAFPTGPFLLAATMRVPVYLVFGLFFEPNRYCLFCEPFADPLVLPRESRQEALQAAVQRYARRLEAYAMKAPDNWFNFYDFWRPGP